MCRNFWTKYFSLINFSKISRQKNLIFWVLKKSFFPTSRFWRSKLIFTKSLSFYFWLNGFLVDFCRNFCDLLKKYFLVEFHAEISALSRRGTDKTTDQVRQWIELCLQMKLFIFDNRPRPRIWILTERFFWMVLSSMFLKTRIVNENIVKTE